MMAENETRDEALDLLLPWYVNGTLDGEERRQVEAYLERNAEARDEVALLRELRAQVKQEPLENSPGELGLKRLKRDIEQAQRQERAAEPAPRAPAVAGWWRPLAVAACLAVIIQAGVLLGIADGPGEVGIAGGGPAQGAALQVTFAPEATEQELREVLQSAGATIADGPNALGVYRLRLVDAEATSVEEALATLRARADVVTFAERN